jgi:hypothetical protein
LRKIGALSFVLSVFPRIQALAPTKIEPGRNDRAWTDDRAGSAKTAQFFSSSGNFRKGNSAPRLAPFFAAKEVARVAEPKESGFK